MIMAQLGPHLFCEGDSEKNIIESASEIFEIDDFTSPSAWEKFISNLEQILREWNLHKLPKSRSSSSPPLPNWPWRVKSKTLKCFGFEFNISEFSRPDPSIKHSDGSRLSDLEEEEDEGIDEAERGSRSWRGVTPEFVHSLMAKEFPSLNSKPIHYYYGLNHYIVLAPGKNEREDIDNESRSKMALSSIAVALNNTRCSIPCFVQVMDRESQMFNGIGFGGGLRTNYEMIVLKKRPPYCDHLTGLLNLFKSKIRQDCSGEIELHNSVKVSARFSYILDLTSTVHEWSQAPPDLDMFSGVFGSDLVQDIRKLPFGTAKDPIKQLILHTTWQDLPEDIITDNDVHSDLDLMEAPAWSISTSLEDQPQCLLSEYLRHFRKICDQNVTVKQLLGEDFFKVDSSSTGNNSSGGEVGNIPDVFNRLTGTATPIASGGGYSLSSLIGNPVRKLSSSNIGGPIRPNHLIHILDYLFPDAAENSKHPYPKDLNLNSNSSSSSRIHMKTCPVDGLVWRLTIVFAHCLHVLGGLKPLAHLIHEFFLEVRFRWENSQPLPGLPAGVDFGSNLFHQKLQMINCCVERKIMRDNNVKTPDIQEEKNLEQEDKDGNNSDTDEEDIFFDCDDDEEMESENKKQNPGGSSIPIWSKEPIGRAKRLKIKLLNHDEYIYIPVCQDPTPLTEDMLAEQADVMLQLGMDSEGAQLRAKMQSASLLSDMESFKAANPGAVLADFVRWHSPRDWDSEKGKLSVRMEAEGNIWLEAWDNAKPVPARRQKRLFDDTREAEKVLQYMTSLKPSEVADMLIPVLQHASVVRILDETQDEDTIPQLSVVLQDAMQKLSALSRLRCLPEVKHFTTLETDDSVSSELVRRTALIEDVARLITKAEADVSTAFSLRAKFLANAKKVKDQAIIDDKEAVGQQMKNFVKDLFNKTEVSALGAARGPVGQLIIQMFKDAHRASQMLDDLTPDEENEDSTKNYFPKPYSREFVLKVSTGRPYTYSAPSPQRFFCRLTQNEFRVAGAFTLDQQFL